jgi:hypothetical protein
MSGGLVKTTPCTDQKNRTSSGEAAPLVDATNILLAAETSKSMSS